MKKYIIFALIAAALVASGFYINHRMTISKFNSKLEQAISKDQALTETILKIESESSSISYGELFELCDKSVKDRTDLVVELRGLYADIESALKDSLIEFLNAENELIRSKSQAYRSSMNLSSDKKSYDEMYHQWSQASYTVADIYQPSLKKEITDLFEHAEGVKSNTQTFIDNFNKLSGSEEGLSKQMTAEGLRFKPIYKKYAEANLKFMKTNMEYADLVMNQQKKNYDYMQSHW